MFKKLRVKRKMFVQKYFGRKTFWCKKIRVKKIAEKRVCREESLKRLNNYLLKMKLFYSMGGPIVFQHMTNTLFLHDSKQPIEKVIYNQLYQSYHFEK